MPIQAYKAELIDFFLKSHKIFKTGAFTLKSGRPSPDFMNFGECDSGEAAIALGKAYAAAAAEANIPFDTLVGPAYKGIPLAVMTAIALKQNHGINVGFTFDRKEEKEHGDATGADLAKKVLVGYPIQDGTRAVLLDDVITTGATKNELVDLMKKIAQVAWQYCLVAVDRQEVGVDGESASAAFTRATGIQIRSILSHVEIHNHLAETKSAPPEDLQRIRTYMRVYGVPQARKDLGVDKPLDQRIIEPDRSVIPACDVTSLEVFEALVKATAGNPKIGGYKIGFGLGYRFSLPKVVEVARKYTKKPIILDHQKAATDIPDTAGDFASTCQEAGIDTVIFFPESGPETERAYICQALNKGLKVIVGGRMTHLGYSESEGGWITNAGALQMYRIAARIGVTNFVVPGNKLEVIAEVKKVVEAEGVTPTFYSPGFVAQGGKIGDAAKVAGNTWHAIVGRGIYAAKDFKAAANELTRNI